MYCKYSSDPKSPPEKQLKSKLGYIVDHTDKLETLKVGVTSNEKESTAANTHMIACKNIYYMPCKKKLKRVAVTGTAN